MAVLFASGAKGPCQGGPDLLDEARARAVESGRRELARVSRAILDIDAVRDYLLPASRIEISSDDFAYDIDLCSAVK